MLEDSTENKILKYLILAVIVGTLIILIKEVILKPEELEIPEISLKPPQIEIDFDFLQSEELKELLPFEKISFPEEVGRENPFISY